MKDPQLPDIDESLRSHIIDLAGKMTKLLTIKNALANNPEHLKTEVIRSIDETSQAIKSEIQRHYISYDEVLEMLNRIEASIKMHTVPEGERLVTRRYVVNTLEFERQKLNDRKTLNTKLSKSGEVEDNE